MSETDTPDGRSDEERPRDEALPAQQADSGAATKQTAPAEEARADDEGSGSGRVALIVAVVALIVALLAIAAAVALWYFGDRPTHRMTATVGDIQHRLDRQASALDEARARLQKLQGVADAQDRQGKRLQQLGQGVSSLQRDVGEVRKNVAHLTDLVRTGQRSWALIEVEHLLEVANSRLQLRRDVAGAVTALTLAQQRLARLDDPSLYSVRKAVQESITNLGAVPVPDVEGMSLTLSSLAEAVPRLPLKRDVPAEFHGRAQTTAGAGSAQQSWWQRGWHSVVTALSGMVAIRRSDHPTAALLAPRHEYFLYQNLQLKLEAARLSLLERDGAGFHTSIATALDWLNTYFKPDAASVKAMKSQLSGLAETRLTPTLPDISAGLDRIRERLDALRNVSIQPPSGQQAEKQQKQSPPGQQAREKPQSQSSPQSGQNTAQQPGKEQKRQPQPQQSQSGQPTGHESGTQSKQPQSQPSAESGQSTTQAPVEKPKQQPQPDQRSQPKSQPEKPQSEKPQPEKPQPAQQSRPEQPQTQPPQQAPQQEGSQ